MNISMTSLARRLGVDNCQHAIAVTASLKKNLQPSPRYRAGGLRPCLAGLLLLGLFNPALSCRAAEITLSKASLRFNTQFSDKFALQGSYKEFDFPAADTVQLTIGPYTESIPAIKLASKPGKLVYQAPEVQSGVYSLVINTRKSTFSVKGRGVTLSGLLAPTAITIKAGTTEACRMMAPKIKRKAGDVLQSMTFKAGKNPQFDCVITSQPKATPNAVFLNKSASVLVVARILADAALDTNSVKLWRTNDLLQPSGASLQNLLDNGKQGNGDDIAGDGVYSNYLTVKESVVGASYYQVSADLVAGGQRRTVWSPAFALEVIPQLSQQEIETVRNDQEQAADIWSALADKLGETADARKQAAKAIKNLPGVKDAGVSSDGLTIWIDYVSGADGILLTELQPATGELAASSQSEVLATAHGAQTEMRVASSTKADAGAAASPTEPQDIGNNNVLFWEAFSDDYNPSFNGQLDATFKNAKCPLFKTTYIHDEACTVATVRNFPKYGTVIITSHGGVKKGDVVFSTRQSVNWGEWWNSNPTDRLLTIVTIGKIPVLTKRHYYGITPRFIADLSDFDKTLIVNAACNGFDNDTLKNAFIGHGAATYYGWKGLGVYPTSLSLATKLIAELVDAQKTAGEAYSALPGTTFTLGTFTQSPEGKKYGYSGRFRNGDFETGDLKSWNQAGDGRVVSSLGKFISQSPGAYMGLVSTGLGKTTQSGRIWQNVCLPKDATQLKFSWNFSSEEFIEYCGKGFQDTFKVELITKDEIKPLLTRTIDDLCKNVPDSTSAPPFDASDPPCTPTSGVGYGTGGNDCKVYSTGWQPAAIDIANYAKANDGSAVTLEFSVTDVGDSSYDSAVLLDNIQIVAPAP